MSSDGVMWMAAGSLVALSLVALWMILRRLAHRPGAGEDTGSPRLFLDGTTVVEANSAAQALLGLAPGADALDPLSRFFGADGPQIRATVETAGRVGRERRAAFVSADGTHYAVRAFPRGGQIGLELTDASAVAKRVAAESAPPPSPPLAPAHRCTPTTVMPDGRELDWRLAALEGLTEQGALILWERDAEGRPCCATGSVRFPEGRVSADQVTELMTTRRLMLGEDADRRPAGGDRPEGSRLEVVHGASVLPLSIVETETRRGEHIGFAVEASAAASAERTLTRFVQTMTETFAHLTVGLAIFDKNRTLALFNPALVNMWTEDAAWLARKPGLREILDRLRDARRVPEKRDYRAWRDRLLGLFDDTERAEYEELWNLADGSTIRVLARPHPHGSLAFIFDDVTERMRLERRNRHMDDLINSTLENLHEGLAVFGADGTLQFVNAAFHAIWGTDSSSVRIDMHASDLGALCSRLTVETEAWDRMVTFATGEENRRAWTARLSLGSGRMLGARFAPLPDGSTMALFSDVTDSERIAAALRDRNEALETAEQMRSAVLDQISHRLRTPLNTIFGFGELLGNPRFGPLNQQQQHYVSGVLEAASQLLDTIGAVTELASLQIDPLEGEAEGFGVEEVLETVTGLLERRAIEGQVGLSVDLAGAVGVMACNPVRLRQIIFNLTADAIHRCPSGGEVRLCAHREEDGTVQISTLETIETGQPSLNLVEINSLTLSLVRRLVALEGGALEIRADEVSRRLHVICRFPDPIESVPLALDAG